MQEKKKKKKKKRYSIPCIFATVLCLLYTSVSIPLIIVFITYSIYSSIY